MRKPANLGIIDDPSIADRWLEKLQGDHRRPLAIDTETTGLRWDKDRVGGLCLAAGNTACYFYGNALENSARWLSAQIKRQRPLVFHNAKYDMHMLRGTFGIHINYPVDDTMVMSFLIDNRGAKALSPSIHGGHGLKNLASAFVDPGAKQPEDDLREAVIAAGGRRGKKAKEEWKADILLGPPKLVGKYGAMDAWYTLRLHEQFLERIHHTIQPGPEYPSLWSLYETERWLILALRDMEARGVRVDLDFFEEWKIELEKKKEKALHELEKLSGCKDVNWNSAPQIREVLFKKLKLRPNRWTSKGEPSTDEVTLTDLAHPIGRALLNYREIDKQLGTYAIGLLNQANSWSDLRIHANFKQTGARTGRLSCEDPNLQQQTRESGVRRGFIPDEGLEFRFADYSQMEMRMAAHFSNDPVLVNGFINDPDFDTHAATAMKMWGLRHQPSSRQRKFAKIMNFAMLFGAGEDKVTSQLVSMLSAKEAIHSIKELGYKPSPGEPPHRTLAQLLRKIYFAEFPSVRGAKYAVQDATKKQGFTVNGFGRRRFLGDDEVYKAFNTIIQGTAADQAKKGLVDVYRELEVKDRTVQVLLQIHDEIVYQSDGDPSIDRKVLELLNDTKNFRVPIVADMKGSKTSWQDKFKVVL